MYTEHAFCLRAKESINMIFKDIERWEVIKMFDKDIPRSNCVREEAIHVSIGFPVA